MESAIQVLNKFTTVKGANVVDASANKRFILVFLRHFGCSFCRESLSDIQKIDVAKNHKNFEFILVHMASADVAYEYFRKYKIEHLDHIVDKECILYKSFGLSKANFNQLFGFRSWLRGIETGLFQGHGWGMQLGDGFQMPGIFTIYKGSIIGEYRHLLPSDRPDYEKLISCRIHQNK